MSAAEQLPFAWLGDVPSRSVPAKGKWVPRSEPHRTVLAGDLARCADLARVEQWTLDAAAASVARVAPAWMAASHGSVHEGWAGNGLESSWRGAAWCHPPWDDTSTWVEHAWHEAERELLRLDIPEPEVEETPEAKRLRLVVSDRSHLHTIGMLVPADTAAPWWQLGVEPHRDGRLSRVPMWTLETYQLGRLRFSRPGSEELSTATPCALVVWRREGIFQGRW